MRTWIGRLDELGVAPVDAPDGAPGTIVVGEVANLSTLVQGVQARAVTPRCRRAAGADFRRRKRASKERVT